MTDGQVDLADELEARARRLARNEATLPDAIDEQRRAVELRAATLEATGRDVPAEERSNVAHRLSDSWGRLGGMFRRANRLDDAIDAYRVGKDIEAEFGLLDSYNLGNWIAVRVLRDPGAVGAMHAEIDQAMRLLSRQVEGARRDQWWAWADLGMLALLDGEPALARAAYEGFATAGARPVDYRSTLDVVRELADRLGSVSSPLVPGFFDAISQLETQLADTPVA
jgi:hypothetical protein